MTDKIEIFSSNESDCSSVENIHSEVQAYRDSSLSESGKRLKFATAIEYHKKLLSAVEVGLDAKPPILKGNEVILFITLLDGLASDFKYFIDFNESTPYQKDMIFSFYSIAITQLVSVEQYLETSEEHKDNNYIFTRLKKLESELYLKKFFAMVKLGMGNEVGKTTELLILSLYKNEKASIYLNQSEDPSDKLTSIARSIENQRVFLCNLMQKASEKYSDSQSTNAIIRTIKTSLKNPKNIIIANVLTEVLETMQIKASQKQSS